MKRSIAALLVPTMLSFLCCSSTEPATPPTDIPTADAIPSGLSQRAIATLLDQALAAQPSLPPEDDIPPPNTPFRTKLLSGGNEPRGELRWRLSPAQFVLSTEHHEQFMHSARVEFSVALHARLQVDVLVDGPSPRAEILVLNATRETTGQPPPALRNQSQLNGRRFSIPLTHLGSDGVLPSQILEDRDIDILRLYTAVQSLWTTWPSEPIGDTATWLLEGTRENGRNDSTTVQSGRYSWHSSKGEQGYIVASVSALSSHTKPGSGTRRLLRRQAAFSVIDRQSSLPLYQEHRSITELADAREAPSDAFFRSEARGTIRITPMPR